MKKTHGWAVVAALLAGCGGGGDDTAVSANPPAGPPAAEAPAPSPGPAPAPSVDIPAPGPEPTAPAPEPNPEPTPGPAPSPLEPYYPPITGAALLKAITTYFVPDSEPKSIATFVTTQTPPGAGLAYVAQEFHLSPSGEGTAIYSSGPRTAGTVPAYAINRVSVRTQYQADPNTFVLGTTMLGGMVGGAAYEMFAPASVTITSQESYGTRVPSEPIQLGVWTDPNVSVWRTELLVNREYERFNLSRFWVCWYITIYEAARASCTVHDPSGNLIGVDIRDRGPMLLGFNHWTSVP